MDDWMDVMRARHSVRQYTAMPISPEDRDALAAELAHCNAEGGLHLQLVTDEPDAFGGFMAHYGKFDGVRNYIALVGKKGPDLEEKLGWYGERLVLLAQRLGLNSCWVALTFRKGKARVTVAPGEKLVAVIALGHGRNQGQPRSTRDVKTLAAWQGEAPAWFLRGMEAAQLAPTAMNQQHFRFTLAGAAVRAESTGGFYSRMDLGIAKYHFTLGAGKENFTWAE